MPKGKPRDGKITTRTRKLPPVRQMSKEEAAWLGALVEGEGTVRVRVKVDGRWTEAGVKSLDRLERASRITPHEVIVYSSDVEIISACLRLTGVGTVYYRPPRPTYRSPNGRMAFAVKDGWSWECSYADQLEQLLPQIVPYLTSKKFLARVGLPVRGGSCHPTHWEGAPDTVHNTPEDIERNWADFKKQDRIDPRAIRRQHRFKPGHEPDYAHPDSGWVYLNLKFEGEPGEPDQRDLLHGGPPAGMNCERCGEELHVVGRMSKWDIMNQDDAAGNPLVRPINLEEITTARKRELQKEFVAILACPNCRKKYQWDEALLPKRVQRG